ncbi:MAG: sulfotransferase [Casimicrobiaceae bacterium]
MTMTREAVWWRGPWNRVLKGAASVGWRGMDVEADHLLACAQNETGLDDFGDWEFLEPMQLLLREFKACARADDSGRHVFFKYVLASLRTRLRIRAAIRAHPEIARMPVLAPLFIVGLPRTGTTLLQGLLARVDGLRTPLGWETCIGDAPAGAAAAGVNMELLRARLHTGVVHALSPALASVHEVGVMRPEECNPLLMTSFRTPLLPWLLFDCPDYVDHVYATRFRNAYEWHKLHLQVLAYRQPAATWVLKGPVHLASLDELLRVYPDARVIFTHRDPVESIPSMGALTACLRMLISPLQDRKAIGPSLLSTLLRMHEAAGVVREHWPIEAPRLIDVRYDELVRDPEGTVRCILRHFDLPQSHDLASSVAHYLRDNRQHRRGRHRYCSEDFGLDEREIRTLFQGELHWRGADPSQEPVGGTSHARA